MEWRRPCCCFDQALCRPRCRPCGRIDTLLAPFNLSLSPLDFCRGFARQSLEICFHVHLKSTYDSSQCLCTKIVKYCFEIKLHQMKKKISSSLVNFFFQNEILNSYWCKRMDKLAQLRGYLLFNFSSIDSMT